MKKYMHTINGHPAFFDDQIVFAEKNIKTSQMVDTLYQIRKEQLLSSEYRKSKNFFDFGFKYGYIIVYLWK